MSLASTINSLVRSPKKLFLIDAFGALITALSLSLLLTTFQIYFGMPLSTLYILSGIAVGSCFYSFSIYKFVKASFRSYLILLICINSLYCLISTAFVFIYLSLLTTLGIAYFALEVLVITGLLYLEWKIYRQLLINR